MHNWFRRYPRSFAPNGRRPLPAFRPSVEPLEDRLLLSWTIIPGASLGAQSNALDSVSAFSATDAWAVGSQGVNPFQTLAEHWNGSTWNAVHTPTSGFLLSALQGVDELSPTNVWAVGWSETSAPHLGALIEHYDGTKWSIVTSPFLANTASMLNAVTAVSPTDIWAVGTERSGGVDQPLTEHWDGTRWSVVPNLQLSGQNNILYGVAAAATNDVWAVGTLGHLGAPIIEHWNGSQWSLVSNPEKNFGTLSGVTVVSSTDAWAVGNLNQASTLIEHWDGNQWSIVPSPNGSEVRNGLSGVAAVSANRIFAVGFTSNNGSGPLTLTEQWNGQSWQVVPSPSLGTALNGLGGVAALSTGQVWAVGDTGNSTSSYQALILSMQPIPPPAAAPAASSREVHVPGPVGPTPAPAPTLEPTSLLSVSSRAEHAIQGPESSFFTTHVHPAPEVLDLVFSGLELS
jgi:hypothetical protein